VISQERQELFRVLAEFEELCPEVRLGQLITNLAYLAKGAAKESVWDVEDAELLAAARIHLEEWKSRRAAAVA
jgi:hypothetical protein